MFSKGKAKEDVIADDSTPIKPKDNTPPPETAAKDAEAGAATDGVTHTHVYPKVDEARVRRVLAKQKDAEDFVAEYNRRARQRRAPEKSEPDATESEPDATQSAKSDMDTASDDDSASDDPPKRNKALEVSRRGIMRSWPRAPGGPFIYMTGDGKVAGNNQPLWGATVLDFFRVQRDPAMPHGSTISTGSKLAAWAHVVGELHAKDELNWAAEEEDPIELLPCDISLIIRDMDYRPSGIREMFSDTHKTVRVLLRRYMRVPERHVPSLMVGRRRRCTRFFRTGYHSTFSPKSSSFTIQTTLCTSTPPWHVPRLTGAPLVSTSCSSPRRL